MAPLLRHGICWLHVLTLIIFGTLLIKTAPIQVLPLWNTNTTEHPCNQILSHPRYPEELVVPVSTDQECSFNVRTMRGSHLSISSTDNGLFGFGDYVYVKLVGNLSACSYYRYAVFDEPSRAMCQINIAHENLNINIRANVTFYLNETINDNGRCPERNGIKEDTRNGSVIEDCNQMQGYDYVKSCQQRDNRDPNFFNTDPGFPNYYYYFYYYFWTTDTRCDLSCPSDCNCSLSNKEVVFHCKNAENVVPPQRHFILLPREISNLNFSSNRITNVGPNTFDSIGARVRRLDLSWNDLILNRHSFQGLTNLKFLGLSDCNITTIEEGLFMHVKTLTELWLDWNRLTRFKCGAFKELTNVKMLNLRSNELVQIESCVFRSLTNMEILIMYENNLRQLGTNAFHGLNSLRELDIGSNNLGDQTGTLTVGLFDGLNNLTHLYMNSNGLVALHVGLFSGLHNLLYLVLSINRFTILHGGLFDDLSSLTLLHISSNKLATLGSGLFQGLNSMRQLTLHNNYLSQLDVQTFKNLSGLAHMTLSSNRLVTLQEGVFQDLVSIVNLHLQNNSLVSIHPGVFDSMRKLYRLSLAHNKLTNLAVKMFRPLVHVVILDLSHNKLNMLPELDYMQDLSILQIRGNVLNGLNGDALKGLPFTTRAFVDQPVICECYLQYLDHCSSTKPESEYLTCSRLLSEKALLIFMWLLGISATFGNVAVLYLKKDHHSKERNKVQSLLLGHLATSDLLMGIYMLIIASADIYFGEYFPLNAETWRTGVICKLAGTLCIASSEASVLIVTLISVDRFICMKYPYTSHKLRPKSTWIAVSFVWVFSFSVGIVPSLLAGWNPDFYDNSHVCIGLPLVQRAVRVTKQNTEEVYDIYHGYQEEVINTIETLDVAPSLFFSVALFLGFNLVCFLVIFITYVDIIKTVSSAAKESRRKREMREQVKLTTKVAAIVATDFCCWFPIIVTGILVQTGLVAISPDLFAWAVTFILPINSAINPILYTLGDYWANKMQKNKNNDSEISKSIDKTLDTNL